MGAITRQDRLKGKVSHEEYYRSINKTAGLTFDGGHYLLPRVKAAIESGDEHLNSIELKTWDRLGENNHLRQNLDRALKLHNDSLTLATIVCCLKQAAKDAV